MNTRIIPLAAVLVASTLALAACAGTPAGGTVDGGEDGDIVGGPGIDLDTQTITVGALVPVSGIFAGAITNIEGMEAGFHRATSEGGVLDGWTVNVVNQDTKFDTATTIPLYESFKNDIAIISLALGATIMDALLPTVTDDNLLMIGAGPNPGEVREERIIPTFPLLSAHAAALIPYAVENYDAEDARFCTITVEEPFGEGFVTATDFAVESLGLERGIDVTLAPTADQLSPQVSALKEDGCDVVVGGGYGAFLQAFAVQAAQLDYEPLFLTSNAAYSINVATGPGADWISENVLISVPGDEWEGTHAIGQANLREDLAAVNPDATPTANAHLTGYVNALYTSEVLAQAIENGDLSREGIVQAVSEFEVWPDELGLVGGDIVFGASADERILPHKVSMFRVDADVPTGLRLETYYYDSDVARDFMAVAE